MNYANLLDYLGDRRPPEWLTTPPGGDMGPANPFVCDIAETLRAMPGGRAGRAAFLRHEITIISALTLPSPLAGQEPAIVARLSAWRDELALTACNTNEGERACTAR